MKHQQEQLLPLIQRIKTDCKEEDLISLIKTMNPFMDYSFYYYRRRYPKCYNLIWKDFSDNKPYLVYQAVCKFNPEKSKFTTFMMNQIKYYCLKQVLDCLPRIESSEKEELFLMDTATIKEEDNSELFQRIHDYINHIPDERIREIFKLRYYSGKKQTYQTIGKKFNQSRQWVQILHERGLKLLRNKFNSKSSCNEREFAYN